MEQDTFIVICRGDTDSDSNPGKYELATRQIFSTIEDANIWYSGIAERREPIVVAGRFLSMREPAPKAPL